MRTHDRNQADHSGQSFLDTFAYVNPWHAAMTDFIDTMESQNRKSEHARKQKRERLQEDSRPVMRL